MNLGERCDEIVRLIDETLADLGIEPEAAPGEAPVATLESLAGSGDRRPARARAAAAAPGPVAAGF